MLIICVVTPMTVPSVSRPASGVPMLTAMMRSTPIARATSTGRLSTSPPSPRMRPSTSIGANRPGTDMLARSACARSPSRKTTASPLSMSVATARKGIGRPSKLGARRTASVWRRSSSSSSRLDTEPIGSIGSPPSRLRPTSIAGEISKSSSLRRWPRLSRGSRVANIAPQSIAPSSRRISSAPMPLA